MVKQRYTRLVLTGAAVLALAVAGAMPGLGAVQGPGMPAPVMDPLQVSGTSVTVRWRDASASEDLFQVYRRDPSTGEQTWYGLVATLNKTGQGDTYTQVDTIPAGSRQCYGVLDRNTANTSYNLSSEVCTIALPDLAAPTPGKGTLSGLDTTEISGVLSSIAIGTDGRGLISYYVGGNGSKQDLRVAHCVDVECTSVTTSDIDTVGDVGQFSSLKIGSDGLGIISYVSDRIGSGTATTMTEDLKVAHCQNIACTSATITTLDAPSRVETQTGLTIGGDGMALISYQDDPAASGPLTSVKLAHCQNIACTTATLSTIDTVGGDGFSSTAITTSGGFGLVAYFDGGSDHDLKITACKSADCVNRVTTTVDNSATGVFTGGQPSITVGRDGLGLVSYIRQDSAGSQLIMAHCVNLWCTAATTQPIDTGGYVGRESSIALGNDGLGVISYYDSTNADMKVAHCTNLACSTATTTTLDGMDNVGHETSIAIGTDGLPLTSYFDLTNGDLKVAHCANTECTGRLIAPF